GTRSVLYSSINSLAVFSGIPAGWYMISLIVTPARATTPTAIARATAAKPEKGGFIGTRTRARHGPPGNYDQWVGAWFSVKSTSEMGSYPFITLPRKRRVC